MIYFGVTTYHPRNLSFCFADNGGGGRVRFKGRV